MRGCADAKGERLTMMTTTRSTYRLVVVSLIAIAAFGPVSSRVGGRSGSRQQQAAESGRRWRDVGVPVHSLDAGRRPWSMQSPSPSPQRSRAQYPDAAQYGSHDADRPTLVSRHGSLSSLRLALCSRSLLLSVCAVLSVPGFTGQRSETRFHSQTVPAPCIACLPDTAAPSSRQWHVVILYGHRVSTHPSTRVAGDAPLPGSRLASPRNCTSRRAERHPRVRSITDQDSAYTHRSNAACQRGRSPVTVEVSGQYNHNTRTRRERTLHSTTVSSNPNTSTKTTHHPRHAPLGLGRDEQRPEQTTCDGT
ncbi:hypothetical protein K466DRAFT_31997 [Polyporus arcularius HHB13444]|uniref:Uncharacterized protein n=1 Tax=Polyporus arcularius HHB13444 TaxID=1314778 RepID=A0A5C3P0B8_9APHY|nr:hypothetical protein K466DRAFT_31997 [Polyporus arcularius HHB13444]